MLSEVIITWTVPVGSPITAPCVVPPERERPPIDKRPRYHGTMRFDAGPNNYSEHDVHVSLDQIVRILEIVHEPRLQETQKYWDDEKRRYDVVSREVDGMEALLETATNDVTAWKHRATSAESRLDDALGAVKISAERKIEAEGRLRRGAEIMLAALRRSGAQLDTQDAEAWLEESVPAVETCRPDPNPDQTIERLSMLAEAGETAKAYIAAVEKHRPESVWRDDGVGGVIEVESLCSVVGCGKPVKGLVGATKCHEHALADFERLGE